MKMRMNITLSNVDKVKEIKDFFLKCRVIEEESMVEGNEALYFYTLESDYNDSLLWFTELVKKLRDIDKDIKAKASGYKMVDFFYYEM